MFDDLLVKTVSCRLSFLCGSLSKLPKHMTDSSIFRFLLFDTVRSISGSFSPVTITSSLETLYSWYSKVFINVVKIWIFNLSASLGRKFWTSANVAKQKREQNWAKKVSHLVRTYLLNYYVFNFAVLEKRRKNENFENMRPQKQKINLNF